MPRTPGPLPADLGAVFTPQQARARGVSARRLRAQDLERPYFGLVARRSAMSRAIDTSPIDDAPLAIDRAQRQLVIERARVYRPLMVAHAFFAGRTSAVIHGLPVYHPDDLEVAVFAPQRAPRRQGIRGRKVSPELASLQWQDDLPVASPASTWAMLGSELSIRELVILGDAIVRIPRSEKGEPRPEAALATIAQLHAAIDAGHRPGARKLRRAVESIRVGSASPLETEFRLDADAAGLPTPQLDVEIRDRRGRLLGITEIVYEELRVLIEVEGDHHRRSREQWIRDIEKYAAYVAEGWEVVRLTSAHIRGHSPRAVAIVREALLRHGWRP